MALNPNIILQAGNFERPDFGKSLTTALGVIGARDDQAVRQQQMALNERQIAAADRAAASAEARQGRMATIGGMAAQGDVAGAQRTALEAGDFDAYAEIAKLTDAQKKHLETKYDAAASVAAKATEYPLALRRSVIAAAAPMLKGAGWTDEELANIDPTDEFLAGTISSRQTVKDVLAQQQADRTFKAGREDAKATQADRAAMRDLTRRGQDITMRGQNMTDARAGQAAARAARQAGPGGVKLTEGQAKDGFNAKRLAGAGAIIDGFENTPGFAPGGTSFGAMIGGDKSQRYEAAKGEWVDSLIRLTTGAAATADEVEAAKETYFPGFRDGDEAVTQKAQMRARVMQDAIARAGPGAAGMATPAAPKAAAGPTATGPNGQKVMWNGSAWVPAR